MLPHRANADVKLVGYDVPKGSNVLVNVWAIARNPAVWKDPLEFRPERFADEDVDMKGHDFRLLPFGARRRVCPGAQLGINMVQSMLGHLLHQFRWERRSMVVTTVTKKKINTPPPSDDHHHLPPEKVPLLVASLSRSSFSSSSSSSASPPLSTLPTRTRSAFSSPTLAAAWRASSLPPARDDHRHLPAEKVPMASPALLFLFLFLVFRISAVVQASDTEALRLLLTDFGGGLEGQLMSPVRGGASRLHPCRVPGVTCERRNGVIRAVRIALPSRGLDGSLSFAVGRLSALRELSLPGNLLSGEIPAEIAGCRKLQALDLSGNAFSGRVPMEISSLARLRSLDLSSNQLRGDLEFLTFFPNLENHSVADNLLTGPVPPSISSFRNLLFLDLSGNPGLRGTLPARSAAVQVVPLGRKTTTTGVGGGGRNLLSKRYVLAENSTGKNTASQPGRKGTSGVFTPAPAPPALPTSTHRRRKRRLVIWFLGSAVGALTGIASGMVCSVLVHLLLNCIRGRAVPSARRAPDHLQLIPGRARAAGLPREGRRAAV
ncbi:hypothetical protein Taro_019684 [Colocasia esculenta]|uniref:Uncharacterized protein n=1 Tax=Colocasia esculenta TaxID=4460 RepID=A0A843ULN0_COLES|nr:hypothetical protein [Colocasia esculenta]